MQNTKTKLDSLLSAMKNVHDRLQDVAVTKQCSTQKPTWVSLQHAMMTMQCKKGTLSWKTIPYTRGETIENRTRPSQAQGKRYLWALWRSYLDIDGYMTTLDYHVHCKDNKRSIKHLIMTTLNICNARRYDLQRFMTEFLLQLSYYECRWINADTLSRLWIRSLS